MNIIEKVKDIVQSFPKIAELCGEVHVDFADPDRTSYGLSSMGDTRIREDVTGRLIRQHSFMLYATFSAASALTSYSWEERQTRSPMQQTASRKLASIARDTWKYQVAGALT